MSDPLTAEHTEIDWYRVPGADRLWPTREDAAYYNGWHADFADSDIESVALCSECSGEPCTSVLIGEVTVWPCGAGGAMTTDPKQALQNVDPKAVYDSSTDGPQYHLTTRIDGRTLTFQKPIEDPFVRCTVRLGWRDLLRGLLRRRLTVEVLVDSDNSVLIETVLGLDAEWLTPKRRARFNKGLNAALSRLGETDPDAALARRDEETR